MKLLRPVEFFLSALIFLLVLGGCAPQSAAIIKRPPAEIPRQALIDGLPFFAQEDKQCGPAALAAALNFVGLGIEPGQLSSEVFLPGKAGSLQADMISAVRRHGLLAYEFHSSLENLLWEISAGRPVIVLQNLGLSWHPVWHYAVAAGYDLDARKIILNSGREQSQKLSLKTFEQTWARSKYWSLMVLRPGELPVKADPNLSLAAAFGLESAGKRAEAAKVYAAIAQRWPFDERPEIALGGVLYMIGDLAGAERALRAAVNRDPDSAPALNNLAQVLLEQGKLDQALKIASRGAGIDGPHQESCRRTLAAINAALKAKPASK